VIVWAIPVGATMSGDRDRSNITVSFEEYHYLKLATWDKERKGEWNGESWIEEQAFRDFRWWDEKRHFDWDRDWDRCPKPVPTPLPGSLWFLLPGSIGLLAIQRKLHR
jgi:hypothetical protein